MTPEPVDRALMERIEASLRADLRPVRPLPPAWALILILMAIFAATAIGGAGILGLHGWHNLAAAAATAIFVPLAGQAVLLAEASVQAIVPGARRVAHPAVLAGAACLLMVAIFAAVLHDYRVVRFVPAGLVCLRAGLIWAAPAGIGAWLVLRRGYAVDRRAAGLAAGALAGFAGITMLELHCPNLQLAHVAVWHTAVAPLAALAGYFLGSKRRAAELMQ